MPRTRRPSGVAAGRAVRKRVIPPRLTDPRGNLFDGLAPGGEQRVVARRSRGNDDVGVAPCLKESSTAPTQVQLVAPSTVGGDNSSQGRLYLGQVVEFQTVGLQRPVESVQDVNPLPSRPGGPGHRHLHATLLDDLLDSHHLDHAVDDFDCGETSVGRTPLLPRAVAAGAGAPLRDAPAGRNGHFGPAPSADDLLPRSARRCWRVSSAGDVAGGGVHGRLR